MLSWLKGHEFRQDFNCLGDEDRIPPCRAKGILSLSTCSLSTSLHQDSRGNSQSTCSLSQQINYRRVSSEQDSPPLSFKDKTPRALHQCRCIIVYIPVTSGFMSRVLVILNSGALPRYSCVSWWNKSAALSSGFSPAHGGFSLII